MQTIFLYRVLGELHLSISTAFMLIKINLAKGHLGQTQTKADYLSVSLSIFCLEMTFSVRLASIGIPLIHFGCGNNP